MFTILYTLVLLILPFTKSSYIAIHYYLSQGWTTTTTTTNNNNTTTTINNP